MFCAGVLIGSVLVNTMKKFLHGVFPELLLSLDTCVLTGNTDAFIWYYMDGVFGIGTMLIQLPCYGLGLSLIVKDEELYWMGGISLSGAP